MASGAPLLHKTHIQRGEEEGERKQMAKDKETERKFDFDFEKTHTVKY